MSRDFSRKPCAFCNSSSVLPSGYCDSCHYHQTGSRCEHCDRDLSLNTPGDQCDNCDGFIGNPEDEDGCTCGAAFSPPDDHDDSCPIYIEAHENDDLDEMNVVSEGIWDEDDRPKCPKCKSRLDGLAGQLKCKKCGFDQGGISFNQPGDMDEGDDASGAKYEDCEKCMGTGDDLGGAEEGEKCWACGGSGKERVDDDYVDPEASMTKKSSLGEAEEEFGDFESVVWADQAEKLGFDSSSHAPTTVVIPKHYVDNVHALEYLPDGAVEAPLPNGDVEVTLPMWEFDDYLNGICCGDYDSMDAIWASHKPAQVHEGAFSEFSHRDHQRSMGKEECGWCSGDSPSCDHCDGSGYVDAKPTTEAHDEWTCPKCVAAGGEGLCPHCDAMFDEPHGEECPFYDEEDAANYSEGVSFDKFMDRTLLSESKRKTVDEKLSPQRQLARNYQENPLGKTRIGVK